MKLATTEKDRTLFDKSKLLPDDSELNALRAGNYLRLKAADGSLFWALVLERRNGRFIVRLDDSTPELARGAITSCGCSNVFGVV